MDKNPLPNCLLGYLTLILCISIYTDPKNVYDGNMKLILGLIWTLIRHFQISAHSIDSDLLLAWVRAQIPDQNIKNFTTDWNDGIALCALVNHIKPDLCPNYSTLDSKQSLENCSCGINLAEEELGVVKIIEAEDLCDPDVDRLSVMTYISSFCKPANEYLLKWVKGKIPDLDQEGKITNLNTDWQNGVNLASLLDALKPGCFPSWQELDPAKASENLIKAMKIGEEHFGVKPFTISDGGVDELSLATYLTHLQRSATSIPTKVVCKGHGLSKAFVGRPATFEVDATRALRGVGDSELSITITDSKNTVIKPQITPTKKGIFRVEYKPLSTSKLKIEIKWKDFTTTASVDVIDMASLSFNPKQKCIKIGDPIVFEVKGTSDFKDGDLDILLQDASGATDIDVRVDNVLSKSEGTVECSLKVAQPGKYKVVTKLAGVNVPGSPFQIKIADPQQYAVQMSELNKDGRLKINKPVTFTITPKDANSSCLVAKLQSPGASEPRVVSLSQHNGSIIGKFTPTEGGVYNVLVTCAGENIHGSPIQLTATDPYRCIFNSNLPRFVQVGVPCKVNLSTKGAGPGEVKVSSSQTESLAVNGEQSEDQYAIQFIPKQIGESTIDVKFDGESLPSTPHVISICDASKCIASGEVLEFGRAKCNEQIAVTVQTKGAGKGELTVKLTHGPKTPYTHAPKGDSEGTYHFTLTPYEAGIHFLNILWGGVHIPKSPCTVKVTCDATQFVAQGKGVKEAIAHRPAEFVLKGPQSGLLKEDILQVKIRGAQYESRMVSKEEFNPASEEALVCVTETQKGKYVVEYSVPVHGNFTIYMTIDDKAIPKSPFNVKVHPDPTHCKVFGNAIEHPHSLVLSKSIEFKVDTTEAGAGELTVTATDPTSSEIKVISKPDWKNKVYKLKVDPKMIGEHKFEVYWNKGHIPGSPFLFSVCDPSKVKVLDLPDVSNYSAEVEKPLTFLVDAKEAGKGQLKCTVKVKGAQDNRLREIAVEPRLQDDGTYVLEFIPHEIGRIQLDLTYNGESILPRPWKCEIASPVPIRVSLLSNNSHEKQTQPVKFKVSGLTKGMANKVKISINHPRHKSPKIHKEQQQEGSIVYHFIPQQLGKYNIGVKIDGKDIHGSPFSVKVVNPEACIIKEDVPTAIFMQQRKQFVIDTSKAGPGELSCEIENQESSDQSSTPKLSCETISTDSENALVELHGLESGECRIFLKWGSYHIRNMPLDITVYDPAQCSYKCEQIAAGKVKTSDEVFILIDTTKAGSCEPTIKASGPSTEYHVDLDKIGEGGYKATFVPHESGHQSVEIFVDDVMLPHCPLTFKLTEPEPEDPHRGTFSDFSDEHDTSVTFSIGVETNDTDTSKLHVKAVNPKKRYQVRVEEEKSGEWTSTCTAIDEGEQELRVMCSESELIGRPIKIFVSDQKKYGGLKFCKVVLAALLVLLMFSVIATFSLSITDSEVRPY